MNLWLIPPKRTGFNSNKRSLSVFSQMAFALTAFSKDKSVTAELKTLASKFEMMSKIVSRHVDAYPNLYSIWIDLNNLRTSLFIEDNETERCLTDLEQDIASLQNLIENHVTISAGEKISRSLRVFMGKERLIQSIYFSTIKSIRFKQRELDWLNAQPKSEINTDLGKRIRQIAIQSLTECAQIFTSIIENLALLESFCKNSSTLCRRVNRLIDTKKLSNFIDQPEHSQNEARSMHTQLLLILENIKATLATEYVWNDLQDKGNQSKPLEMVASSTVSDNKPNESEQQNVSETEQQTGGQSTGFQNINKNGGVI